MKPTKGKIKKETEYKAQAWLVDGSWGVTAAFSSKERALEEKLRIEKVGFSARVIPCTITYKLPLHVASSKSAFVLEATTDL